MKIYIFDGLICTDVVISFKGKSKKLKNVVIDTGAVQSIINSLAVEELEILAHSGDKLLTTVGIGGDMNFFYSKVDKLEITDMTFENIEMDFGEIDPKGEIMGLVGLDLLKELRAVIDVEIPMIHTK
jgi:predicted aspartyl protease